MKTRNSIFRLSCLASALLLLGGCNDAKYGVIRHAVYFTDAEDSPQKSVVIEETGGRIPITVRSVGRVESDVTVHCVVDPAVLDDYNAKAGTNFALLPEAIYTVPESFVIPQGQAVSIAGVIEVGAYTEEMKNSGSQFALPLRLVSGEGGPQLLASSECLVLSLDQVIVTSAIVLSKAKAPFIHLPFSQAYELSQWTLEFRFNKSMMTNTVGQNIAFGGDEGGYEVRTAVGASHKFYAKVNTVEMSTPTTLEANRWYHGAVVCDGVTVNVYLDGELEISKPAPGGIQKFRARFAFGNGLLMAGEKLMGSECRLWSVARTQSQIKFNMYRVNPESEGLLAYWRFDEGEGREFTNLADPEAPRAYLAKSISAAAQPPYTGEPEWVHGVRSDEN